MQFRVFIISVLILITSVCAFAQSRKLTAVAVNKTKAAGNDSKYVVTVEEAAEMRLDAAKKIEKGWQKVAWKKEGIDLVVPEDFRLAARRNHLKSDSLESRRWESRLPQPNEFGYNVRISVETLKNRGVKTAAQMLNEEEDLLNATVGDASENSPITRLKLNGVEGIVSRLDAPHDVRFTWTAFRLYKGKLQKIRVEISGREEVLTGVRQILQSIKIARD
jgi:hypothetical protein